MQGVMNSNVTGRLSCLAIASSLGSSQMVAEVTEVDKVKTRTEEPTVSK